MFTETWRSRTCISAGPGQSGRIGFAYRWARRKKWKSSEAPSPSAIRHKRALHYGRNLSPDLALRFSDSGVCDFTLVRIYTFSNRVAFFASALEAFVSEHQQIRNGRIR